MSLATYTECIALLVKAPRTNAEIMELMGINNRECVPEWMRVLKSEGLVYISGWQKTKGRAAPVYAWQPSVCANPDAPNPYAVTGKQITDRDQAIVAGLEQGNTYYRIAKNLGINATTVRRAAQRINRKFNPGRFA